MLAGHRYGIVTAPPAAVNPTQVSGGGHAGDGLVAVPRDGGTTLARARRPARSRPGGLPHERLPTRGDVLSNRCAIGPLECGPGSFGSDAAGQRTQQPSRRVLSFGRIPAAMCSVQEATGQPRVSISPGQPMCGAPRRNRTGDPSLPSMRRRFAFPCNTCRDHITAQVSGAVESGDVRRREVARSAVSGKSLARPSLHDLRGRHCRLARRGHPSLHITVRPKLAAHPRRDALPRIRVEQIRASLWAASAAGAVARSVADSSADGHGCGDHRRSRHQEGLGGTVARPSKALALSRRTTGSNGLTKKSSAPARRAAATSAET